MGVLDGVRILDLTQVLAGPYCTTLLGSLGAEIIKIESWKRLDGRGVRFTARPSRDEIPTPPRLAINNSNKRSVALDLSVPEGREAALSLAKNCDVVIEAFRPGVMAKLGLSYQDFRDRNPSVLMVSISGNGNFGPDATHASYAGIFCALGGLTFLTGYDPSTPTEYRGSGDLRVGWHALLAVLAGLWERGQTGQGRWIDLAGREVMAGLIGDAYLAVQVSSERPLPEGNGDGVAAPSGCYQSATPEEWVALSVENERQWLGLCRGLNRLDWANEGKFGDGYLRWTNRDALNRAVSDRISEMPGGALVSVLQAEGVPAALSATAEQVFRDEQLKSREFLHEISADPIRITVPRLPWVTDEPDWHDQWSPPSAFGKDTEAVLAEVGGLDCDRIARFADMGILA